METETIIVELGRSKKLQRTAVDCMIEIIDLLDAVNEMKISPRPH